MHVLAIVLGFILLLFGGGCTLIFLVGAVTDPRSFFGDIPLLLTLWLPLGLAPLAGGYFLFRYGRRRDEEVRRSKAGAKPDEPG
jgi:hypothetical protein